MNKIDLNSRNLVELTEEDLKALCDLKELKYDELYELYISGNKLENLNCITENTPFINIEKLSIGSNYITDISNIKYLQELRRLNISHLSLDNENETLEILKTLKNLNTLISKNTFENYKWKQIEEIFPHIEIKFYGNL